MKIHHRKRQAGLTQPETLSPNGTISRHYQHTSDVPGLCFLSTGITFHFRAAFRLRLGDSCHSEQQETLSRLSPGSVLYQASYGIVIKFHPFHPFYAPSVSSNQKSLLI